MDQSRQPQRARRRTSTLRNVFRFFAEPSPREALLFDATLLVAFLTKRGRVQLLPAENRITVAAGQRGRVLLTHSFTMTPTERDADAHAPVTAFWTAEVPAFALDADGATNVDVNLRPGDVLLAPERRVYVDELEMRDRMGDPVEEVASPRPSDLALEVLALRVTTPAARDRLAAVLALAVVGKES
jgi:hypothetical protein